MTKPSVPAMISIASRMTAAAPALLDVSSCSAPAEFASWSCSARVTSSMSRVVVPDALFHSSTAMPNEGGGFGWPARTVTGVPSGCASARWTSTVRVATGTPVTVCS